MLGHTDLTRREFLRVCAIGAGAAMLASCAPKATPAAKEAAPAQAAPTKAPAQPAAAETHKIIIWQGFGTGNSPSQQADQNKLAEECTADLKDKGISVEMAYTPHAEHLAKFTAMLAAGDPPDIVMPIGIGGVAELYDQDAWMDIKPLIDRDNYDMSDFYGPTKILHTYEKGTLGLPMAVYPSFIYYNKDLFAAAGVDELPHKFGEPGYDFDKLRAIAQKLTLDSKGNSADKSGFDPSDIKQWGLDESWQGFVAAALQFGAPSSTGISDDRKTSLFDHPAYGQRAQWINDNVFKYHIAASADQSSEAFSLAGDPFSSGLVGMFWCHTWMMGQTYAELKFGWDVGAVPKGPTGVISSQIDADTFVMPAAGKQHDQAWEVAKWCCSPGKLERYALTWGSVPARLSSKDTFQKSFKEKFPNQDYQVVLDAIDVGDVPNHEAWVPNPAKIGDAESAVTDKFYLAEESNCAALLQELDKTVQGLLDEYWKGKGG